MISYKEVRNLNGWLKQRRLAHLLGSDVFFFEHKAVPFHKFFQSRLARNDVRMNRGMPKPPNPIRKNSRLNRELP
jgi:hypothetical protein